MDVEQFRKSAHELVDWIADYRERVATLPVRSSRKPGEIRTQLPTAPPVHGESMERIFQDIDRIVVPGLSHWQHPSFYGYFPAISELSSVLGDFLSTGLGVIGLAWQSSPALTEIEEVVTDWLRQMVGLSSAWKGVIQDTASTSSLIAMLCARERASQFSLSRGGLQGEAKPLIIYTTAHSHSSVDKAALLAGFGRENIHAVPVDAANAMRPEELTRMIREDRARGMQPCAIAATVGTTGTTAIDPIGRIADIASREHIWLHVDAAMAGSAMILPELRWMWEGVEAADSIVFNPHKWMGAAFDCSVYYVKDAEHLIRVMSTSPSYLRSAVDEQVRNLRDWGIPLGRRFRSLKLWFLIREQGVEGLQKRIRRDIENARWLEAQVQQARGWKVVAPTTLQTVCIRHEPEDLSGEALDRHTLEWCERLNTSGKAYLTPAMLDGRWMVRVSIGGIQTEREHIQALWRDMRDAAMVSSGSSRK